MHIYMTDIKVQIYFMCYVLHITVFFGGYLHFLLFISTRICAVEIIFWDHRHICKNEKILEAAFGLSEELYRNQVPCLYLSIFAV